MQVKIFPFSDSINWNHREHNEFADVTLAYEDGQHIEAHKGILAVSSAFFQTLPKLNWHPHQLICMEGIKFENNV